MFGPVRVAEIKDEAVSRASLQPYEEKTGALKPDERIFFKTANSDRDWLTKPFSEDYVAFDAEAAQYLVERKIAVVGVDYLSVAPFANTFHTPRTLLGAGV